jgi:hypothetical protein
VGGKSAGNQTTTVKPDAGTQHYLDYYRQAAMNLGGSYMGQFAPGAQGSMPAPGSGPVNSPYPVQMGAGSNVPGSRSDGFSAFGGPQAVSRSGMGGVYDFLKNSGAASGPSGPQPGVPGGPPAPLGVDPSAGQAGQTYGQLGQMGTNAAGAIERGQQGLGQLANGDASTFFNPYQNQVVDAMHSDFDRQRQFGLQAANQQATAQGAFGGSRQAVLQAQNLDNVNQNEASTLANLRNTGYQQAFGNGLAANGALTNSGFNGAQLGLNAAGGQLGFGDYRRGIGMEQQNAPWDNAQRGLGILSTGINGGGQTTTQPTYHNPLGGAIGGASAGFGIGGPVGAGIGGFLGLFS